MSDICPGCGRCRECGQPAPQPVVPYPVPFPVPFPQPSREPVSPWRQGEPIRITCQLDGRAISDAVLARSGPR